MARDPKAKIAAQRRYSLTEKYRVVQRRWYQKLRRLCLVVYSGDPPRCLCKCGCAESRALLLEIHHVDGEGGKHRKEIGGGGAIFYAWLKRMGFPSGYSVLCPNCHTAEHVYGKCEKTS